ncbi:hypothetical protein C2I36_09860 [Rhodobacteraceae bacterium WD3A24]|nr:hypothetical protein C2I36_09860 [Rhodobacteraceae bacterium WD3A24]
MGPRAAPAGRLVVGRPRTARRADRAARPVYGAPLHARGRHRADVSRGHRRGAGWRQSQAEFHAKPQQRHCEQRAGPLDAARSPRHRSRRDHPYRHGDGDPLQRDRGQGMSYSSIEESTAQGRPLYLYQFNEDAQVWRFTNRPETWVSPAGAVANSAEALTWEAIALAHSNVVQTGDVERGSLELTFPISNDFARRFLGPRGRSLTTLTIFRGHEQLPEETVAHWKGRVLGASLEGQRIVLKCESQLTALKRAGVRAKYQKLCRHPLYGRGCDLDIEDFYVSAPTTGASGATIVAPKAAEEADGWYRGGVLRHAGALGFIIGHVSNAIVLARAIPEIAAVFSASAELASDIAADAGVTTIPITNASGIADVPAGSFATIDSEVMRVTAATDTELTVERAVDGSTLAAHTAGAAIAFRPVVELARGCDLRRDTCEAKFNNLANFGGFPNIPGINPFGGSSIV